MKINDIIKRVHALSEDRHIDIISAKVLAEDIGMHLKNEGKLLEWKQAVDQYLSTFSNHDSNRLYEMANDIEDTYAEYRMAGGKKDYDTFSSLCVMHPDKNGKEIYKMETTSDDDLRATSDTFKPKSGDDPSIA